MTLAPSAPAVSVPTALTVVVIAGTRVRIAALGRLLEEQGVEVVGGARTVDEAEELLTAHVPRAVLLDLDLDAGGLDVIERIMAARPTPIVVAGAAAQRPEAALAAGAVDVVGALDVAPGDPEYGRALYRHLHIASRVRVISHPRARLRRRTADDAAPQPAGRLPLVAIGASTGGPPALAQVLAELPRGFEASVVVVQHMADGFVEGLARWLDEACRLPVVVAADGERLRTGVVHLAPAGTNLEIAGSRVRLTPPRAGQYNVPGVDVTFASVAAASGPRAVGVLLTGMGRDGAIGLRAMRDAGATTIGQDEATSVVWGMPGAAQELDAVGLELPLDQIGEAIVTSLRRARRSAHLRGQPSGASS